MPLFIVQPLGPDPFYCWRRRCRVYAIKYRLYIWDTLYLVYI